MGEGKDDEVPPAAHEEECYSDSGEGVKMLCVWRERIKGRGRGRSEGRRRRGGGGGKKEDRTIEDHIETVHEREVCTCVYLARTSA